MNDGTKDNEQQIYFIAPELNEGFSQFHDRNTHLRAVTKAANLSILKRKS